MPRARNIKHQFFTDVELLECNVCARLLFAGLWTIADREGRLIDKPKQIKLDIFPGDNVDVDGYLCELADAGLIVRYEVDATRYIQIRSFTKHQNPHKAEPPSKLPPQPLHDASAVQAPGKHDASTMQAPEAHSSNPADPGLLNPDRGLLIAETGLQIADGVESRHLTADGADPGSQKPDARAGEESGHQQQGFSEVPASFFSFPESESAPLSEDESWFPEEPPFGEDEPEQDRGEGTSEKETKTPGVSNSEDSGPDWSDNWIWSGCTKPGGCVIQCPENARSNCPWPHPDELALSAD